VYGQAGLAGLKHSPLKHIKMYHVGQKIVWLTLIEGKVTKVIGEITQIVGEWIWAKGKTRYDIEVTDRLTVDDKSISLF
jgi:hypothetical protein